MWIDPIVEEIHQIRFAHSAKFNFDLHAIFNDLKEHEKKNKRRMAALPIKRYRPMRDRVGITEVLDQAV